ncbi:general vesicular transport factor p115-like [Uranotaenia lowii]|nr:general vesicular transport factor p115-like [Uranotaenia lowii]
MAEAVSAQLKVNLEQAQTTNSQLSDQNILLKAQLQAASDLQKNTQQSPFHVLSAQGETPHHQAAMESLQNQLSAVTFQQQEQQSKTIYLEAENRRLLDELDGFRSRVSEAEKSATESRSDLDKLRRDQEDLMELLTDQETKIGSYRQLLKQLGHKLDDDSDEDEEEKAENGET